MAKKNGKSSKEADAKKKKSDPEITESVEEQEDDLDIIVEAEETDDDSESEVNGTDVEVDEDDESGGEEEPEDESDDDESADDSAPEDETKVAPIPDFLDRMLAGYNLVKEDDGGLLPDEAAGLYQDIQQYVDESDIQLAVKGKSEDVLERAVEMGRRFEAAIDKAERHTNGCIAAYRIWQGKYFNKLQELHNSIGTDKWSEFIETNFRTLSMRSIQDYKLLAQVPNILEWSPLGVERLLILVRALRKDNPTFSGNDPINAFLNQYGFDFDPDADEISFDDVKRQVSTCLVMAKMEKLKIQGVPRKVVEDFIRKGHEFPGRLLGELERAQAADIDPVAYLSDRLDKNSKPFVTPDQRAQNFQQNANNVHGDITYALTHPETLVKFNTETVSKLEEAVRALKMKLVTKA